MQQEHIWRGPTKRKRGQPVANAMDNEQTIIPVHLHQHWLQMHLILSHEEEERKRLSLDIHPASNHPCNFE